MSIGERLKLVRKLKHITQDDLAKQIGTSRGVITNIELEKIKEPQLPVINIICDVLDVNKEWLLYGIGPMDNCDNNTKTSSDHQGPDSNIIQLICCLSENEKNFLSDVLSSYIKHFK